MRLSARLSVAALSFLLLAPVIPVLAAVPNEQKTAPSKPAVLEKKAGMTAEKSQAVITRVFDKIEHRLNNYEAFLGRVKSRRDKLSDEGKNVLKLDTFILTAETNLGNARTAVASAKVELSGMEFTGNKTDTINKVKTEVQKVRKTLTFLHTSMSQAVAQLKAINAEKPVKGGQE